MVQQTKVNWSVMCHVCGAEGGWSNPSDAIALWNKRATPSPGKAQAEREGWQAFWQMAADIESVTDRDGEMFMKGWHAAIQQDKQ
jgi:hypothetical protein